VADGVRLGVLEGEFHCYSHDAEGELVIEVAGSDPVRLRPHQGYTVPNGVAHETSAPTRRVVVMVEAAWVLPTGD
jgi:hypothetical protein